MISSKKKKKKKLLLMKWSYYYLLRDNRPMEFRILPIFKWIYFILKIINLEVL